MITRYSFSTFVFLAVACGGEADQLMQQEPSPPKEVVIIREVPTTPAKPTCDTDDYAVFQVHAPTSAPVRIERGVENSVLVLALRARIDTEFTALVFTHAPDRFSEFAVGNELGNLIGRATVTRNASLTAVPIRLVLLAEQETMVKVVAWARKDAPQGYSRVAIQSRLLRAKNWHTGEPSCFATPDASQPAQFLAMADVQVVDANLPTSCDVANFELDVGTVLVSERQPGVPFKIADVEVGAFADIAVHRIDVEFEGTAIDQVTLDGVLPLRGQTPRGTEAFTFLSTFHLPQGGRLKLPLQGTFASTAQPGDVIRLRVLVYAYRIDTGATACTNARPKWDAEVAVGFGPGNPCNDYPGLPAVITLDGNGQEARYTGGTAHVKLAAWAIYACTALQVVHPSISMNAITSSDPNSPWAGLMGPTAWNIDPFRLIDGRPGGKTLVYANAGGNSNSNDARVKIDARGISVAYRAGERGIIALYADTTALPTGFQNTYDLSLDFVRVVRDGTAQHELAGIAAVAQRVRVVGP